MKRLLLVFLVLGLWGVAASAQDAGSEGQMTEEERQAASKKFSETYSLLVSKLGADGVGVETVLNNWEKVDPENKQLIYGKYAYYMTKAHSYSVEQKSEKKYLGREPVLNLKDSLGNDVYYFQIDIYDDSLFTIALKWIDKGVSTYPKDLYFRYCRCEALTLYEGLSPDMALVEAGNLIDAYYSNPIDWEYYGEETDDETFTSLIQDLCHLFFNVGSQSAYKAFKSLSEKMLGIVNKDTNFLSNVGTYYLVAEKNYKMAFKYYDMVLKIKPDDYVAAKNCVLICRNQKNTKLEKKYLPALIASTPDEMERMSAEARLKGL